MPKVPGWATAGLSAGLLAGLLAGGAPAQVTQRVSVGEDGAQARGLNGSYSHSVSAHGRYVAFYSTAANLVPGDVNKDYDVYVRDTLLDTTVRASVGTGGFGGNGHSSGPAMAADGRYVAFVSDASNLVPGDTNGTWDIFRHDLATRETIRVSVGSAGQQGDASSKDVPSITPDGGLVAFASLASNLVSGDRNGRWDVFVRDVAGGRTHWVSVTPGGQQANGDSLSPSISADGRYVAFESDASNLVSGDWNGVRDVFVHDRLTGRTDLVSRGPLGALGNQFSTEPSLSADGRTVVFTSLASNLVPGDLNGVTDVFVRDLGTDLTECVSLTADGWVGDNYSGWADLSADGRRVVFASLAGNLVPGDTNRTVDVFLYDRDEDVTECRSLTRSGGPSDGASTSPAMSADGRYVCFHSAATDLVEGDTNGQTDQFLEGPALRLVAKTEAGRTAWPILSLDAWTGRPRGNAALFLLAVNGQPLRRLLWQGRFDSSGVLAIAASAPRGWSGTRLTLLVMGEEASGRVGSTNPVQVILP